MKTSTEKMIGRITFSERSGSTMRQQSERGPDSAEKTVRDIRRATRRRHSRKKRFESY